MHRYRYYRRRYRSRRNRQALAWAALAAGVLLAARSGALTAHGSSPGTHGSAADLGAGLRAPAGGGPSNVALGQQMAAADGWTSSNGQWACLYSLWERESGWSNTADTRVTHAGGDYFGSPAWAYGISQARPATKLPLAGQSPDLGGRSDPGAQISWGLGYIRDTYGTPCGAWLHEQADGWY